MLKVYLGERGDHLKRIKFYLQAVLDSDEKVVMLDVLQPENVECVLGFWDLVEFVQSKSTPPTEVVKLASLLE